MIIHSINARSILVASVLVLALVGCGDSSESDSPAASTDPTSTDASEGTTTATDAPEAKQVAWLNASSANTFLQASLEGMQSIADANNIELTVFDAQFDPVLQQNQLQDAITSGKFDGIVLTSIVGPALIPDVEQAIAQGIEVVILNQVVGEDLTTSDPQIDGVAASVLSPAGEDGERLGEATLAACEEIDPCNVVYYYGVKGIPFDDQVRSAFDTVVDGTSVVVVAEGESGYEGPDQAYAQMQDILVRNSEIDVVVGADQAIAGAELALSDAGVTGVRLVASGGSVAAVEAIKEGRWFAGVFAAPRTEGELAMKAMVDALNGIDTGGLDATSMFPGDGIITKENVEEFDPQWAG